MEKITLVNRLSIRIMAVVMVMTVIIVAVVYVITRDSMAREAETRYESVLQNENEKIRGVLSDVYVAAINNVNVIERDIDKINNDMPKYKHIHRFIVQKEEMIKTTTGKVNCRNASARL